MKKYNYLLAILSIFLLNPLFSQDDKIKIEKNIDPQINPPPPEIINLPGPSEEMPFEGDRIVFWVHGLGGDDYSWDAAAAPTADTYKMTSLLNGIDYSSYSLSNAGQILQTTIDGMSEIYGELNGIEDPANTNFIIAHSQGGLVSREAFKRYDDLNVMDERTFGGIVTFGTPHQGAQILNNIDDIITFAERSCVELANGPATEEWNGNWFLGFLPDQIMEDAVETVCGFIANQVLPIVMQDYLEPITEDYEVGADPIVALNEFDEDISLPLQKVAFYGIEDSPVIWRTVYSLLNDVNAEGTFSANYDEELISKANCNQNSYYLKYLAYSNLYDLVTADCFDVIGFEALIPAWNAIACTPYNLNNEYNEYAYLINDDVQWWPFYDYEQSQNRDAYYMGYRWWVEIEESYLSLIGAVDYVVSGCHCDCLEKYGSDPTPYEVLHTIDCEDDCNYFEDNPPPNTNVIHCDYAIVYDKYIKPNDGVVLVESAQNYPGADNGNENVMLGSNHMQMRNDSNTDEKLFNLMNGDHGFFFITGER